MYIEVESVLTQMSAVLEEAKDFLKQQKKPLVGNMNIIYIYIYYMYMYMYVCLYMQDMYTFLYTKHAGRQRRHETQLVSPERPR